MFDEINGSYTDTVIEHFMCPRNTGSMTDADGEGNSGDPACGDYLTVYIKVKGNTIIDISFMVFGCAAAIATGSMTTELARNKTLEAALTITEPEVESALGGLPEGKRHCSNLGVKALKSAINNYMKSAIGSSRCTHTGSEQSGQ